MAVLTHEQPHFVLFPFMAQGHMIPMIDIARLLAQRGAIITILLTPSNANRFNTVIARAIEIGLKIQVIDLYFPSSEAGIPEGCENCDMLQSIDMMKNFFLATQMLESQVVDLLRELNPLPSCLISDMCFPWTTNVAKRFDIPRIVFHGMCSFSLLCLHNLREWKVLENVDSDTEYFSVPDFPDKVELTKAQLKSLVDPNNPEWEEFAYKMKEAENEAYGSKASIDEHHYLKWLDSKEPLSVLFVCLGSLSRLPTSQMIELGLGLESSKRPFIWVVRHISDEFRKWLNEQNFEERIKEQGILIHGWAPQVLILSHASVGGFVTHCGWNSSIEGISAGVPMITWPLFAEQFCNERLIANVLKIGVKSGVENPVMFLEEEKADTQVNKDDIKMVIEKLMGEEEEAEMRRERAKKLGEIARKAGEEGGSSYLNLTKLIQDVKEQANFGKSI
nr:UDP-glycosyltransferase [Nicotiana tabacum]